MYIVVIVVVVSFFTVIFVVIVVIIIMFIVITIILLRLFIGILPKSRTVSSNVSFSFAMSADFVTSKVFAKMASLQTIATASVLIGLSLIANNCPVFTTNRHSAGKRIVQLLGDNQAVTGLEVR